MSDKNELNYSTHNDVESTELTHWSSGANLVLLLVQGGVGDGDTGPIIGATVHTTLGILARHDAAL